MIEEKILTFDGLPCQLGVDEAGRGPVIGPMVYGCAFSKIEDHDTVAQLGFADSKQLTESQRDSLFEKIKGSDKIGYITHSLSAHELSTKMLRKVKYNLNSISHDTCAGLIRRALAGGVNVREVYIDTVGDPERYAEKLRGIFPTIKVTVTKKADSLFPIVSAASICAKVTRDEHVKKIPTGTPIGSGYPGDQRTVDWLDANFDSVFAFGDQVRFSWSTVDELIEKKNGVLIDWHDNEEAPGFDPKQKSMSSFFSTRNRRKIFTMRNLKLVTSHSIK